MGKIQFKKWFFVVEKGCTRGVPIVLRFFRYIFKKRITYKITFFDGALRFRCIFCLSSIGLRLWHGCCSIEFVVVARRITIDYGYVTATINLLKKSEKKLFIAEKNVQMFARFIVHVYNAIKGWESRKIKGECVFFSKIYIFVYLFLYIITYNVIIIRLSLFHHVMIRAKEWLMRKMGVQNKQQRRRLRKQIRRFTRE